VGKANPDADEELELAWRPFIEVMGMAQRGELNDGKTGMALLRAQARLQL
jgi:hypothetical protein